MRKLVTPDFRRAVEDYYLLLERGYPEARTRHLVADRYGLSRMQRTALHRGVFSADVNRRRAAKLTSLPASITAVNLPAFSTAVHRPASTSSLAVDLPASTSRLAVDFFNVLYTVMNYLFGRLTYISTDGFLRDNGEDFPLSFRGEEFYRSARLVSAVLEKTPFDAIELFIDADFRAKTSVQSPVGEELLDLFRSHCTFLYVTIAENTDQLLSVSPALYSASSDTRIIDAHEGCSVDLPRTALEKAFFPHFSDLRDLVKKR